MTTLLLSAAVTGASEVSCPAQLAAQRETALAMSYETFDQTEGSGFRTLAERGCAKEAADLIVEYIRYNDAQRPSLRWHVAQLRATSGETKEAIRYAHTVLRPSEDFAVQPLRWNDYVQATIAFLERDREALLRHRNAVAAGKKQHFGNALNLRLLDSLVQHFDQSYAYATSQIGLNDP